MSRQSETFTVYRCDLRDHEADPHTLTRVAGLDICEDCIDTAGIRELLTVLGMRRSLGAVLAPLGEDEGTIGLPATVLTRAQLAHFNSAVDLDQGLAGEDCAPAPRAVFHRHKAIVSGGNSRKLRKTSRNCQRDEIQ